MGDFIGSLLGELILGLADVRWLRRLRIITTMRRCEASMVDKGLASLRPKTARRWEALLTDGQECWFEYGLSAHRPRIDSCVEALRGNNAGGGAGAA